MNFLRGWNLKVWFVDRHRKFYLKQTFLHISGGKCDFRLFLSYSKIMKLQNFRPKSVKFFSAQISKHFEKIFFGILSEFDLYGATKNMENIVLKNCWFFIFFHIVKCIKNHVSAIKSKKTRRRNFFSGQRLQGSISDLLNKS